MIGQQKAVELSVFPNKNHEPFVKERIFIFGTDKYGRDYLSRILVGARLSFFIGFVAVFISLLVGLFMGSLAGVLWRKSRCYYNVDN